MTTIPASDIVDVVPSVISAGGDALDVIGLILTTSTRIPIGTVPSFPDAEAVGTYFGSGSAEKSFADTYFAGFNNAAKRPGSILFAQYNESAVAAFLRGGDVSGLTLTQLQALTGNLSITVDGYARAATGVSLSAATSFSSAAGIIETALNAVAPTEASVTAAVGAKITGAISATTLTVSAVAGGVVRVGAVVTGSGVTAGTTITALGSGTGGTGTYTVSASQSVGSEALVCSDNVLTVSAVGSGTIAVGQSATGSGLTTAVVTALGTGTGTTGTYILNGSPQQFDSAAVTMKGTAVAVTYDSTSGGFVVTSGVLGAPESSIAFATSTLAAGVKMTEATGAVISQGADAAEPDTFMDGIIAVTTNWVTYATMFDPDGGSGNTIKLEFAAWKNTALGGDRFAYICWDTDASAATVTPDSGSMGIILGANNDSGTCLIWAPDDATGIELAAFICGAAASIDFEETNGRITFAFKSQDGIAASVTTATAAANLGGDPQGSSRGNGYNFYGAYGAANQNFIWFQRGFVTGDFLWLDAFIDQVQLNNSLQAALLNLENNARSIPYTAAGRATIEQALADPIAAGLNFGSFAPGEISNSQAAEVNQQAGASIASTIQTQGYYVQIGVATAVVRNERRSPPCKFWYLDRGSVQAITLNSIAVN
jgi:hypothetical protein